MKTDDFIVVNKTLLEEWIKNLEDKNRILDSKLYAVTGPRDGFGYAHDYDMNITKINLLKTLLRDNKPLKDYLSDAFDKGVNEAKEECCVTQERYTGNNITEFFDEDIEKGKQRYLDKKEW